MVGVRFCEASQSSTDSKMEKHKDCRRKAENVGDLEDAVVRIIVALHEAEGDPITVRHCCLIGHPEEGIFRWCLRNPPANHQ